MTYLGIDIGGTRTKIGTTAANGSLVAPATVVPTASAASPDALCALLSGLAIDLADVDGVGIAIPGRVAGTTVTDVWNELAFLGDPGFRPEVQKRLGRPVALVNDAIAAGLAEWRASRLSEGRLLSLTLGTGLGAALVIDGTPSPALGHLAGHVPLRDRGRACFCGRSDCLESLVAGNGLLQTNHSPEVADVAELFALARAGEPSAAQIYESFLEDLSEGLAVLTTLVEPSRIHLGGGIGGGIGGVLDTIADRTRAHLHRGEMPLVLVSQQPDTAGVIGAALIAAQSPADDQLHPLQPPHRELA